MTPIALTLTLAALFNAAGFVPNGPAVMEALPPDYPEVAIKARMTGKAVVDVRIDEDGCVVGTESQGVNPLLAGAARRAAAGWRFVPGPGAGERCATLVFEFVLNRPDSRSFQPAIESASPHSLAVAGFDQPIEPTEVCRLPLNYYPLIVFDDPWSTRFYAKALDILPLR